MDSRLVIDILLQHLTETTVERNQLRAQVVKLEQQLAERPTND
jgi:hypothetical protein